MGSFTLKTYRRLPKPLAYLCGSMSFSIASSRISVMRFRRNIDISIIFPILLRSQRSSPAISAAATVIKCQLVKGSQQSSAAAMGITWFMCQLFEGKSTVISGHLRCSHDHYAPTASMEVNGHPLQPRESHTNCFEESSRAMRGYWKRENMRVSGVVGNVGKKRRDEREKKERRKGRK